MCQFSTELVGIEKMLGINVFMKHHFRIPEGAKCLKLVKFCKYDRHLRYYSIKNRVLIFMFQGKDNRHGCYRLFFPPPDWVKWCCPSSDNVEIMLDGLGFEFDESGNGGEYLSFIDQWGDYVADQFDDCDGDSDTDFSFLNESEVYPIWYEGHEKQ